MNHYTDKDMTSEQFTQLLKEKLEKGESVSGYSYSSSNGTKVITINTKRDRIVSMIQWTCIIIGIVLTFIL